MPSKSRSLPRTHEHVVRATRVAGRPQTELARGIRAQQVPVENATGHQVAVARGDAFVVERRAAERLRQVGTLVELEPVRENLLPRGIEQERRTPVLAAAAYRARKWPIRPRATSGANRTGARVVASLRAPSRATARAPLRRPTSCSRFELAPVAGVAVPVVPLHFIAVDADHRAADSVQRAGVCGHEAVRVAVRAHAGVAAHPGALRVRDAPVDRHRSRLAGARELEPPLGVQIPWMREIEIGDARRERVGIGESRAGVLRRKPRDAAGLGDRFAQRLRAQVGRACGALARAEVHGDAHAAVALVLDGLDLAHPHRHRQAHVHADRRLGLVRAARFASAARSRRARAAPAAAGGTAACRSFCFGSRENAGF